MPTKKKHYKGWSHGRDYGWNRLTRRGAKVRIMRPSPGSSSTRTAALAYAYRHGFGVDIVTTASGALVVRRTS